MKDAPRERFVSEALKPLGEPGDPVAGEPGLPEAFLWRGERLEMEGILDQWKGYGADKGGSDERYLRRHWYHLLLASGDEAKIYFERHGRGRQRWWLYALIERGRD